MGLSTLDMLRTLKAGSVSDCDYIKEAGLAGILGRLGGKGITRTRPGFFKTMLAKSKSMHYGRKATKAFNKANTMGRGAKYQEMMQKAKGFQRKGMLANHTARHGSMLGRAVGRGANLKSLAGGATSLFGWNMLEKGMDADENLKKYRAGLSEYYNNNQML